jgi:hypothetical protein
MVIILDFKRKGSILGPESRYFYFSWFSSVLYPDKYGITYLKSSIPFPIRHLKLLALIFMHL